MLTSLVDTIARAQLRLLRSSLGLSRKSNHNISWTVTVGSGNQRQSVGTWP